MRARPEVCKQCGARAKPAKPISWRALCTDCQFDNIARQVTEFANREGDSYLKFCQSQIAYYERELARLEAKAAKAG